MPAPAFKLTVKLWIVPFVVSLSIRVRTVAREIPKIVAMEETGMRQSSRSKDSNLRSTSSIVVQSDQID